MASAAIGPVAPSDIESASTYNPATDTYTLTPDTDYFSGLDLVVPDTSSLDLPGQLSGIPGGSASNGGYMTPDSTGINTVYTTPAVNPTPTGNWMQTALQVIQTAAAGFSTFVKGSPSAAVPPSKAPTQPKAGGLASSLSLTTATGGVNWWVVGGVVAVGVVGIILLAKYA